MSTISSHYDTWLQYWGFEVLSPFSQNSADREQKLSGYFYAPQFWGDAVRDVSHVIHGPWGSGKTAICHTLRSHFAETRGVLVVPLDQFEDLRERELNAWEAVDRIIGKGIALLIEELRRKHGLKLSPGDSNRLISLVAGYHHPATPDAFVEDLLKVTTVKQESNTLALTRRGWLRFRIFISMKIRRAAAASRIATKDGTHSEGVTAMRTFGKAVYALLGPFQEPTTNSHDPAVRISVFMDAARSLGFDRVVVLADRLDDLSNAHSDYVLMSKIVNPFFDLAAMHLHRIANLTFKFHVPTDLLSHCKFRRDKLEVHALKWSDRQLLEMLRTRLQYASYNRVQGIEDLVVDRERSDFVQVLLAYATGIPRHLYRILHYATLALCEYEESARPAAQPMPRARAATLPGTAPVSPSATDAATNPHSGRDQRYLLSLVELRAGARTFCEKERASPWLADYSAEVERRLKDFFKANWERYAIRL